MRPFSNTEEIRPRQTNETIPASSMAQKFILGLVLAATAFVPNSLAQDVEKIDEIIVQAQRYQGPAMSAYLSGDFNTAEVEFQKNAACALRAERNFAANNSSAAESNLTSQTATGTTATYGSTAATGQGSSNQNALLASGAQSKTISNVRASLQTNSPAKKSDCSDRAFQYYMMALSQIKLGKHSQAKENLYRVIKLRRSISDAHFRLALLEYQDGHVSKAQDQLRKLKKLKATGKQREMNPEIFTQITYLETILS